MRISIIAWLLSFAILTSGALLAALAQNFNGFQQDRCVASYSIDPPDLNKAIGLPDQRTDDLI